MPSRKIEDLTPRMQIKIKMLNDKLKSANMEYFKMSCTYRSQEEQNALHARSRYALEYVNKMNDLAGLPHITDAQNKRPITWTKNSIHTKREAVDYYINKDGKYCDDLKVDIDMDGIQDWQEFGILANECGLDWGGYWKEGKADYPHVQWRD